MTQKPQSWKERLKKEKFWVVVQGHDDLFVSWKDLEPFFDSAIQEAVIAAREEAVRGAREEEAKFVARLEIEIKAACCECGENWRGTDLEELIEDRATIINQP